MPEDGIRGEQTRAYEIALAVTRAARFGLFRPHCLVLAIAIRDLLESNGITGSSIRVGVRRHGREFQAHAWVQWGRNVLGDRADHVRRFTEVDDLRVVSDR